MKTHIPAYCSSDLVHMHFHSNNRHICSLCIKDISHNYYLEKDQLKWILRPSILKAWNYMTDTIYRFFSC